MEFKAVLRSAAVAGVVTENFSSCERTSKLACVFSRCQGTRPDVPCSRPKHALRLTQGEPQPTGGRRLVTLCSQCEKPELECTCVKYCCFCQAQFDIRMGVDGMYYCPDCREACDVRLADKDEH